MRQGLRVLVTGALGYLGRLTLKALAADPGPIRAIVAIDIQPQKKADGEAAVEHIKMDVRDPELAALCRSRNIDTIVHLAALVTPGKNSDRDQAYSVDVLGTANVLQACSKAAVTHIVITSSGAAYGYHADNPTWIDETDPLRGNPSFAYADHKRQIEDMLAKTREQQPHINQLILRPGTILGQTAQNQITALFDKRVILGLWGSTTPFVFVWDQDVATVIKQGVHLRKTGVYNLAGDGVLTLSEIASRLHKPYVSLPAGVVQIGLYLLNQLGLTQYGPEQVDFLRFRPVLSNRRLKTEFGYTPEKTTSETFDYFLSARNHAR